MTALDDLVRRLAADDALWQRFLSDPAAMLRDEGVELAGHHDEIGTRIRDLFRERGYVPGWPISRLSKGARYNTYRILLDQQAAIAWTEGALREP